MAATLWPSILNPVIANPLINGYQINGIVLVSGVPKTINHSLGQLPAGFIPVDQNAAASIYRPIAATNKTITLEANANVTLSIWIY